MENHGYAGVPFHANPEASIRRAQEGDLSQARDIYENAFCTMIPFEKYIEDESVTILVAVERERVVGMSVHSPTSETSGIMEILWLAVREEFKLRGVGTCLVSFMLRSCWSLVWMVDSSVEALGFYARFGFVSDEEGMMILKPHASLEELDERVESLNEMIVERFFSRFFSVFLGKREG